MSQVKLKGFIHFSICTCTNYTRLITGENVSRSAVFGPELLFSVKFPCSRTAINLSPVCQRSLFLPKSLCLHPHPHFNLEYSILPHYRKCFLLG